MAKAGDVDFDPMCDPAKPKKVNFEEISAAAFRIQSGVMKTPCLVSHLSTIKSGIQVYLKCEFLQYTGSFKERGARNALLNLDPEAKKRGVIAASLGNHSQGMSYHGMLLGIPTTVVMPGVAPLMKVQKCRSFGANVIIHGNNMTEAKHQALVLAKEKSLTYINGYDHPDIIAGQGTIGLEILEQVPDVEAIIIPVGGGGLITGITVAVKHLKPNVLIYGVETDKCASMAASLVKGEPVHFEITSTLADGLAVGLVGPNSFFNLKPLINKMVVVSEEWASRAILRIVELEKYVVEGAGACSVAAILSGLVPELEGKKTVCILSGGNIDTSVLSVCLDRGLVAEYRLVKFKVNIPTTPGSLSTLCSLLSSIGISIKEVTQERAWLHGSIFVIRGVGYHGMLLGIPTTVVMPGIAPLMKVQKCRDFGANVIIHGNNMAEAKHQALILSKEKNLTFIHGSDHPDVIAGQGTIGLEIVEQVPDVEAIVVPVGGGSLITGISLAVKHLKPNVLIYGVETDKCASMAAALLKGEPTTFEITNTIADGLAVSVIGPNVFHNVKPLINKMVVISEDWVSRAILTIVELEKYIVEGAGACSVAAVLSGLVPELEGKKIVCILSGGNIDTNVLSVVLDRGLVAEHRLVKFKVTIPTSPGSISALCELLASIGISVKGLNQERAWVQGSIFFARVKVVCETRGIDHVHELRDLLAKHYDECYFQKEHVQPDLETQHMVSKGPKNTP